MDVLKTIKVLLENLYVSYNFDSDGEMVIIDELGCYIYKGKRLHHQQNLIMYTDDEGTIKIDGIEDDSSIVSKSYIQITEKEKVSFSAIKENSVELQFLNNVIIKINNILDSNDMNKTYKGKGKL
ncbi:MAG: hypothetical protein IJ399_02870 [Bacilli bacterium]|nr:hypothetical protein [Bacilli bacterium]